MRYITANVRDICIGHNSRPIIVQSMCNCDTDDIDSAVAQCVELYEAGSRLARLTTQGLREVESLRNIKARLHSMGIRIPLVADVHFSSEVAIAAASVADKVRINPGNFAKDHEVARREFKRFLKECRKYGTAVRIGINHGSLGSRITELYGNTPKGMQEAMSEWVQMCIDEDFYNVVLSLKASNVPVTGLYPPSAVDGGARHHLPPASRSHRGRQRGHGPHQVGGRSGDPALPRHRGYHPGIPHRAPGQ